MPIVLSHTTAGRSVAVEVQGAGHRGCVRKPARLDNPIFHRPVAAPALDPHAQQGRVAGIHDIDDAHGGLACSRWAGLHTAARCPSTTPASPGSGYPAADDQNPPRPTCPPPEECVAPRAAARQVLRSPPRVVASTSARARPTTPAPCPATPRGWRRDARCVRSTPAPCQRSSRRSQAMP